ncbi:hypothetical protein Vafri_16642, partial [Volvox africanus]
MILRELLPRCSAPQAEVRIITTSTWLESQHVSDAARLHLISARRQRFCSCAAAAQPSAGTRDANKRSPQAFPQTHRGQRSQRNKTNWQQHQSCNQTVFDPTAKKLVEELGALGWQCKSLRQSQLRPGNLESAGNLTAALLSYVPGLPAADLAHCCWALAQIGPAGARDPAVVKFVIAVQQELLASTTAVGDAGVFSSSRDETAGVICPGKGGSEELESPTGPLTHGTPGYDRSAAAVEPLPTRRDRRPRAVRLSELDPKHLSKLAWAVAKMGIGPTRAASNFRGAEVGGSLAAVTTADGWRELQLRWWRELGLAAAAAIRRVQMPPQALCNTLWAFATCGQRHPELLEAAAECIARGLRTRYGPQGVASLFWAFSS